MDFEHVTREYPENIPGKWIKVDLTCISSTSPSHTVLYWIKVHTLYGNPKMGFPKFRKKKFEFSPKKNDFHHYQSMLIDDSLDLQELKIHDQRFEEIFRFKNHEDQGLRCSVIGLCSSLIDHLEFGAVSMSILMNGLRDDSSQVVCKTVQGRDPRTVAIR